MNATGKRARRMLGLNRHQIKFANHSHKSPTKIRRMGWRRTKVNA